MPGIINEDLLIPADESEAVKIIDNLFGVGWQEIFKGATAATDAPNALYSIMATFNLIVLAAVVLFFLYIVGIGVLGTAHEGKPLGSRYNTLWTPIRSAVAVGLLMPLPWAKGLAMLQALLLLFVYHGIGAADNVWKVALEHMRANGGELSAPTLSGLEASDLAKGILDVRVAQEVMKQQMGSSVSSYSIEWVDTGGGMNDSGYWHFQFYPGSGLSLSPQDMGSIRVFCGAHDAVVCDARKNSVKSLIDELQGLAVDTASFHSEGSNSPLNRAAFQTAVTNYQRTLASSANDAKLEADERYQEGLDEFVDLATRKGWAHAGSWYWTIAKYNEEAHGALKDVPSPPTLNVDAVQRATDGKLDTYLGIAERYKEVSTEDMETVAEGPSIGTMTNWFSLFNGLEPAKKLAEGDPVLNLQAIGNGILAASATAVTAYIVAKTVHGAADEISKNSTLGTVAKVIPGVSEKKAAVIGGLKGFFEAVGPIVMMLFVSGVGLGFTLAYYLPTVPFVLWVMGVIGWIIIVIETLVAAPLWAAAHAIPEGEGIAGQHGRQGYMLFMGVLFRPCLMVIGFFMSTLILTAMGNLIGMGFQTFASGLRTGTWGFGGLITLFSLTFLAGGIIITASHRLFGLITWIPDNVMKWIGHNPHALGEQDAESKIRNSFGGFTSTMQNALNPRMTGGFANALKPDKPGGGGKGGGGDKPAADKKTDQLGQTGGLGSGDNAA